MSGYAGLGLLLAAGIGIAATGLPAAFILIAAASAGAFIGVVTDAIPLSLLGSLPSRLVNLLENDLLQALPLYVTMGLLLNRLPVAEALYRSAAALMGRSPSAPLVGAMALGGLLGPMNGSVGASVLGLSRVVAPRLDAEGVPGPTRHAIIAVAATLGVLVPPSLVLILLGDAMLSAHTIAVTQSGRMDRVVNTQDVFHGALVPAGLFLVAALCLAWFAGRAVPKAALRERPSHSQVFLAVAALAVILVLLGGVAAGYFYAVEAAAMGACALLIGGIISRNLTIGVLRALFAEALAITGALFALLIGATTLTLVLRLLGTDRVVSGWIAAIPGGDTPAVALVLLGIGLCAFVLDAFEIIFVVVPIVIPPLLVRVTDAQWVAVLVLLALQTSFLLPPFGYALMMVRGTLKESGPFRLFVRALMPFLVAQWLLLILVLCVPRLVHVGQKPPEQSRSAPMSDRDIGKLLDTMIPPPPLPGGN